MCVIAAIPKGSLLPSYHLLKAAWDTNPHGAGFMYPARSGKELTIVKGLMTFNAFKTAFGQHRRHMSEPTSDGPKATVGVCVHFRLRSHGPINPEMTHPFAIPGHDNVAIAHNGILSGLRQSETLSDTVIYIEDVLAKLPQGWQRNRPIRGLIERDIGRSNKFVVMDSSGICGILNRSSGVTDAQTNVWWSNDYHLNGRPVRNKHASASVFIEDEGGEGFDNGVPFVLPEGFSCGGPSVFKSAPLAPPVRRAVVRAAPRVVTGMTPIITEARYEPDTGEMVVTVHNPKLEVDITDRLTLAQAELLRQQLRNGEKVSECTLRGNPSFVDVLAAMKAHHDATK